MANKKTKTIGIRELSRDLKTITLEAVNGQPYIVMKNSQPVFKIEPLDPKQAKLHTLKDIKKLQFKDNAETNLSLRIDEILYGGDIR